MTFKLGNEYGKLNKGKKRKPFSQEHKNKLSLALKGKLKTPEHSVNISRALTGHKLSEEHRRSLSLGQQRRFSKADELAKIAKRSREVWDKRSEESKKLWIEAGSKSNIGRKYSLEHRKNISIGNTLAWANMPEEKKQQIFKTIGLKNSESLKGHNVSRETRDKISRALTGGHPFTDEAKQKMSLAHLGKPLSPETRKLLSKIVLALWQTPEYWEKQRGHLLQPSKPELLLNEWLTEYFPQQWKYNDGWFILSGKIPDFVNINGKKQVIELFGDYWHKDENPQGRINLFRQYGYDCLVIWEHSLKDKDAVLNEIGGYNAHENDPLFNMQ